MRDPRYRRIEGIESNEYEVLDKGGKIKEMQQKLPEFKNRYIEDKRENKLEVYGRPVTGWSLECEIREEKPVTR